MITIKLNYYYYYYYITIDTLWDAENSASNAQSTS